MSNLSDHFLGTKRASKQSKYVPSSDINPIIETGRFIETDHRFASRFAGAMEFPEGLEYDVRDIYHAIPPEAQEEVSRAYLEVVSLISSRRCKLSQFDRQHTMAGVRAAIVGTVAGRYAHQGTRHRVVAAALAPFYLASMECSI